MKFTKCPLCGSPEIKKRTDSYNFNIDNKLITTPVVEYWECPACGEAFFNKDANKIIDRALLHNRKQNMKEMIP